MWAPRYCGMLSGSYFDVFPPSRSDFPRFEIGWIYMPRYALPVNFLTHSLQFADLSLLSGAEATQSASKGGVQQSRSPDIVLVSYCSSIQVRSPETHAEEMDSTIT